MLYESEEDGESLCSLNKSFNTKIRGAALGIIMMQKQLRRARDRRN